MYYISDFSDDSVVKDSPCNAGDVGDMGSIPGSGRSPGGGTDNPLQYSCLGKTMGRGTWQVSLWGHKESDTTEHIHTHMHAHTHMHIIYCILTIKLEKRKHY